MQSKKNLKASSHSGDTHVAVGFVALDHVIILPVDADDESVKEAVDMIISSINYHWIRDNDPRNQ